MGDVFVHFIVVRVPGRDDAAAGPEPAPRAAGGGDEPAEARARRRGERPRADLEGVEDLKERRLAEALGLRHLVVEEHPVLAGIDAGDEFYFVHGYFPKPAEQDSVLAVTVYEQAFASALGKNNYVATQFHPEKSGRVGLRLIDNFSRWTGDA